MKRFAMILGSIIIFTTAAAMAEWRLAPGQAAIVIQYNSRIVDVYKLPDGGDLSINNGIVSFRAMNGQTVRLSLTNVKILGLTDKQQLDDYIEYHDETDELYYHERLDTSGMSNFDFHFDFFPQAGVP